MELFQYVPVCPPGRVMKSWSIFLASSRLCRSLFTSRKKSASPQSMISAKSPFTILSSWLTTVCASQDALLAANSPNCLLISQFWGNGRISTPPLILPAAPNTSLWRIALHKAPWPPILNPLMARAFLSGMVA